MAQKYDKPAWNYTGPLLALTMAATAAALVVGLPAGWVAFAGVFVTACSHPAPVLTGPKDTPDNSREKVLVFQHRIWLDVRNSLLLGNRWGWRSVWPGYPPRKAFFVSAATGALVAALPLSGQVPTMVLGAVGSLVGWDAPVVEMPWQVAVSSGLLVHHVLTAASTLLQRFASRPVVTFGIGPLRQMWSSRARPVLLIAPLLAVAGAWAAGWGLEQLGEEDGWRRVGMAAGFVLVGNVVIGPGLTRIRLRRWRSVKEAEAAWESRFEEVFTAKEGVPRIVERTIAPCGAIVDVVDAPPKLMASGLQDRVELLQAAYGDPSTRIDVLSSPNLDAAGTPVAGTAHQLRARIVQWPEGSFPNLLDPDLDTVSRDLALEAALARSLDAIGIDRMVLVEATQVADLPEKVDPRLSGLAAQRAQRVRAQIDQLADDDDGEEIARLEATLEEPVDVPRTSPLVVAWRWLRGLPTPPLVTPDDSPLAIWKTTWTMPGIPTPPWASIQAEHAGIGAEASTVIDQETVEVDAVVERRQGFILVGDPVSDDSRYSEESGLELAQVRNVQAEIEWEQRWQQALPQGAQPPTTRFEITRTAELSQRFAREPLVLREQLFATKTGLDAGETYIDPRGKDFEKGMRTSITAAQMVSLVGWPAEKEGQGSRHPHLFLVRWSTQPVPTTPQDVTPDDTPGPVATSAPAWVLAHQVNTAFRAAAVKLPKPEIVEAEPLTVSASSKHAWKVTLRLHGGTTLVDVRKKADAIRSQLACPWMRIQSATDGQVTLFIGDPGDGAKLRRGADVQIRRVDFDQAFIDSTITNTSGAVPTLTTLERLETNDQVDVLDFDLPAGIDASKVRGNREKLRSNLGVEFLDVRKHGASSVRLFTSKHDPLPERVGIPFDDIAADAVPFGVNALGEQMVFDLEENPHVLLLGSSGSGKSAAISTQLHGLIRSGCDVAVIDPIKGGGDFLFAKDWAIAPFAGDVYQAASTLKALYGELERRKSLLGQHGVVKIGKLDERVRPPCIVVVIDEFTSLIGKSQVPPKSEDPAADHARLEVEAENNARAIVGSMVGKLAREARFVGIHLILGTQKLTSKSLDSMPASADLKTNLARVGLGNMTQGDKMSAFRNPLEADSIAEPRIGRGLFEPLNASHPMLMQVWYEENHVLHEALTAAGIETVPDERKLDPTDPRYQVAPLQDFVDVVEETVEQAPVVEDIDLELGEVDLGSLLAQSQPDEPAEHVEPPAPDHLEAEEAVDPPQPAGAASLALSGLDVGGGSWQLVEALQEALASADVSEVIADVDGLDAASEVGASYRELIAEVVSEAGAQLRVPAPTTKENPAEELAGAPREPDEDAADEEPVDPDTAAEPSAPGPESAAATDEAGDSPADGVSAPEPDQDPEDGFDFSFPAPPVVRGGL